MSFHRVLITGANGLVGQALVERLGTTPGYDVLATGRDAAPRGGAGSFGYLPLDVTDPEAVRRVFEDFAPTVVVNCAAMSQVDACEADREACWAVNVTAVETLARQALAHGARLVQISTDFVFDGRGGPYRETDRPNPINFYGRSKLASENAARGAGLDRWVVVRTALVFGTGVALSRSNIALWALGALRDGQPIRATSDHVRTPTYAPDLAAGIERLIRFGKHGLYHVSGREMLSVSDFVLRLAGVCDFDAGLVTPTPAATIAEAPRPERTGLLILKAETEAGFRPRPLDAVLRELAQGLGYPVADVPG